MNEKCFNCNYYSNAYILDCGICHYFDTNECSGILIYQEDEPLDGCPF